MDNKEQQMEEQDVFEAVEIVSIEDCGYFENATTYGSTVTVTLRCGNEFVRCEDILIFESDEDAITEAFYEWQEAAQAGEEGYAYWVEAE
jgi:hypothetical protein